MHFSRKNQEALLAKALHATGSIGWRPDAIAFGAYDGAHLRAVAVFQAFSGSEAELHMSACDGHMLTRPVIAALTQLAFNPRLMGLQRLWAQISAANARAQAAAVRSGFEFEYRKRGGFADGSDGIVLSMDRPQSINAAAKGMNHREQSSFDVG